MVATSRDDEMAGREILTHETPRRVRSAADDRVAFADLMCRAFGSEPGHDGGRSRLRLGELFDTTPYQRLRESHLVPVLRQRSCIVERSFGDYRDRVVVQ